MNNTISQVAKAGGRIVLLGDDTWARLIPGKWIRSHAMYSFHTWDLDTVDSRKIILFNLTSNTYKQITKMNNLM